MRKLLFTIIVALYSTVFYGQKYGGTIVPGCTPITKTNESKNPTPLKSGFTNIEKKQSDVLIANGNQNAKAEDEKNTTSTIPSFTNSYQYNGKKIVENNASFSNSETNTPTTPSSSKTTTVGTPTGASTQVGITEGQLAVSLTGAASYSIPIAVPPGINGVVPQISLGYSSQAGNGMAGFGWNISGVSMITRMTSTKFHDTTIDAVDFDALDRFAFDGQRLVVKNGTTGIYGADLTVYETENFSNVKITSYGVHPSGANYGPAYFIVQYPDGSIAHYGNATGNSSNSRSLTDYAITYWENPQGVRISYNYSLTNNSLSIASIKYGSTGTITPINEIQFIYNTRLRPEQANIGGQSFLRNTILGEIRVIGNGVAFKNYVLAHETTALNYQRLISITEKTGDNSLALNPTIFSYDTTPNLISSNNLSALGGASNVGVHNSATISGDYDGDGSMDFVVYPTDISARNNFTLYKGLKPNTSTNLGYALNVGQYEEIFTSTWLTAPDPISGKSKVCPFQGVTTVSAVTDPAGNTAFKTYYYDPLGITMAYQKIVNFPKRSVGQGCLNPGTYTGGGCNTQYSAPDRMFGKKYLSGDFNGDGLTDVIAIDNTTLQDINCNYCYSTGATPGGCTLNTCYNSNPVIAYSTSVYFIDLKRDVTTNFFSMVGNLAAAVNSSSDIQVLDFNGDGRSDFIIRENGSVRVYSLNNVTNLLELLNTTPDSEIGLSRMMLVGDYNGDGKSDFLIPKYEQTWDNNFNGVATWLKYTSNGTSFDKLEQTYPNVTYPPNVSLEWVYRYIPMDYDNDGKTDLLSIAGYQDGNPNSWQNYAWYKIAVAYNKNNTFTFTEVLSSNTYYPPTWGGFDELGIPVFYNSLKPNTKLEVAIIRNNYIQYITSQKDVSKDMLLKTITTGNGVTESITYSPLTKEDCSYNCENVYTPDASTPATYPDIDIANAPSFQLVKMIEKQSATVYKKQLFKYFGATSTLNGVGFLGFTGATRTNWVDASNTNITSNVTKSNPSLRGATIENYTATGLIFPSTTVTPTNFISRSLNTYNMVSGTFVNPLQSNNVYKLFANKTQQYNGIDGTNSESSLTYDSYNNPLTSITNLYNGTVNEQTTSSNIVYDNNISSGTYYVGRLIGKGTINTIYPGMSNQDASATEEVYTYTNQLLTQVKKRKINSTLLTGYLQEDNQYDSLGNITKKTITPPNTSVAPRITNYQYDITAPFNGRFLTKSIDIEGLETVFNYDANNGNLSSEINPYSLTTSYTYDKWYKKVQTTDFLGKSKYYNFARQTEKTLITTTGDDGSSSTSLLDDIGRKITSGVKNINGVWSYVSSLYDIYDRNFKTSEPYFGTTPSQWNETQYDNYGRPIKTISFTGKNATVVYNGMTTTVSENVTLPTATTIKTTATTKNAMGKTISMTESPISNNIQYTYFANGNLKSTNNGGIITPITQDGWGRKLSLNDPSAGLSSYTYNDFGETLTEQTPNGQTTYLYDNFGKVLSKTIVGVATNFKSTYIYDPTTKLMTATKGLDYLGINGNYDIAYTFDAQKRIISSAEKTPQAIFENNIEYDAFGRPYKENKKAINLSDGKFSEKKIRNTYQFGYDYQIIDDVSNKVLRQINTVNARGQLLTANSGSYTQEGHAYDQYGLPTNVYFVNVGGPYANSPFLQIINTFDVQRGNLTSRNNSMFAWTENFNYDSLDRLTGYKDAAGNYTNQAYDNLGRITSNNIGTYAYNVTTPAVRPYQYSTVTPANPSAPLTYYTGRQQDIVYNVYKSPVSIQEQGIENINFDYNGMNTRSTMYYGNTNANKLLRPFRKFYSADGTMEIKRTLATNAVEFITYIGGDGYSAPIILKSDGVTQNYLYLHRDYQGSILAITADSGQILEKRLFDAWGALIKYGNAAGSTTIPTTAGLMLLDRGYTGHEHLLGVGLINMNGRIYDPKLHRFLQPDNNLQEPFNSQSYNRYGYCWNNPLKYSDPSGEFIWFVPLIFAVVNVGVDLAIHHGNMNFGQIAMSFGMGYVSGLMGGANVSSWGGLLLSVGMGQVNKFLPAIPIYQANGVSLSISPMVGFGSSGFTAGGSYNFSYVDENGLAISWGYGFGYSTGVSTLGDKVGGSYYQNSSYFVGYNDGHANYGLGYSYNSFTGKTAQGVGAVTIQVGDFGMRIDEDAYIGDDKDRSRTGGMLATYKASDDLTLAFGASMMTGEAFGEDDHTQGNPNYYPKGHSMEGQMVGTHQNEKNPNLRSGVFYAGAIYKGQATFFGDNRESRLHSIQNYIHKNMVHYTPYFADRGLSSKPYFYSGSFHSSYLFY
jgi:RHS repeat-associated protein